MRKISGFKKIFMIAQYLFYFLSFVAVMTSVLVVFSKSPVHSVLYLIVTFFAIAGHYFLLNAQFLGIVHIIVYAGAIMVLFLYVIMMLNLNKETEPHKPMLTKVAAVVAGGLVMLTLIGSLQGAQAMSQNVASNNNIGLIENLGKTLFGEFLLPFEVSSVLFLAAMVGAVFLGKRELN